MNIDLVLVGQVLTAGLLLLVPVVLIIRRAGFSGWWCVLAIIPGLNLLALYMFALSRWPVESRRRPS